MYRLLVLVPILAALVATCLFLLQGGFGGGHGRLDLPIALLGFPAVLFIEKMPHPAAVERHDLALIIWWPAALNVVIWAIGITLVRWLIAVRGGGA